MDVDVEEDVDVEVVLWKGRNDKARQAIEAKPKSRSGFGPGMDIDANNGMWMREDGSGVRSSLLAATVDRATGKSSTNDRS